MKSAVISFVFCIGMFVFFVNSSAQSSGLIAFYPFNGTANDNSGNGHTGTVTGAQLATDRFGNSNSAYSFDGDGDIIEVNDAPDLHVTSAITLCAWAKSDWSDPMYHLVGKRNDTSIVSAGYGLFTYQNTELFFNFGNNSWEATSGYNLEAGTWTHIAVTFVDSTDTLVFYKNGVEHQTITTTRTIEDFNDPISIGAVVKNGGGYWGEMNGSIDDVRIYNYALKADDIAGIVSSIKEITMMPIPVGSFQMGSKEGEFNELPFRFVTVGPFLMSSTEITQEHYETVMGVNPSYHTGIKYLPVDTVSWYDAVKFCNAYSQLMGYERCYDEMTWECDFTKNGFRLPTEAEWEYACRAGTNTNYYSGNRENDLDTAAWYSGNSGNRTNIAGMKLQNSFGLYDIHGNVWEWCNDWFGSYTHSHATNPSGPDTGSRKVVRGGSWNTDSAYCRSAQRKAVISSDQNDREGTYDIGFRVVRFDSTLIEPKIRVVTPDEKEKWTVNTVKPIRWRVTRVAFVDILVSYDGGTSWDIIESGIAASPGLYHWTVPYILSDTCSIMVRDSANHSLSDTSNNYFRIYDPAKHELTSDFPDTIETFYIGSSQTISWTSKNVERLLIEYSVDSGYTWNRINEVHGDTGSYAWTVPDTPSTQCLVRITDLDEPSLTGTSGILRITYTPTHNPFHPTPLRISGQHYIDYDFDGSTLEFPVTVSGTPANTLFLVYSKDQASGIGEIRNGYLGWHTVNKIDTCVYVSNPYNLDIGSNTITWDGRDNDGKIVEKSEYTYYLWAYDSVNAKQPAAREFSFSRGGCTFHTHDEQGNPLPQPYVFSTPESYHTEDTPAIILRQKWIIGDSPGDSHLIETTTYPGWIDRGNLAIDPHDTHNFFIAMYDYNGDQVIKKFRWLPNGNAILITDWGNGGKTGFEATLPAPDILDAGLVYPGNQLLVSVNRNDDYSENSPRAELVLFDINNGDEIRRIDLSDRWVDLDDGEAGALKISGPSTMETRNNLIMLGSHASCVFQLINPHSDKDDEMVLFTNDNGDYVGDINFEEDSEKPWVCNDPTRGPYTYNLGIDAHHFVTFPSYDIGAVSFGLLGPDGTGLKYFAYAGETAGMKHGTKIIDYGSAYDGLYSDNQSSDIESDREGLWYVAQDSFKGLISFGFMRCKENHALSFAEDEDNQIPKSYSLSQNYPNPFNPVTTIPFSLPRACRVSLKIYNSAGKKVTTLADYYFSAGRHSVDWDASGYSSGIYFYCLEAGDYTETKKLMLLK